MKKSSIHFWCFLGFGSNQSQNHNINAGEELELRSFKRFPTIVLFVQTHEDQAELLLVVSEVINKLLKVQLSIQVLVSCFHDFLKEINRQEGIFKQKAGKQL